MLNYDEAIGTWILANNRTIIWIPVSILLLSCYSRSRESQSIRYVPNISKITRLTRVSMIRMMPSVHSFWWSIIPMKWDVPAHPVNQTCPMRLVSWIEQSRFSLSWCALSEWNVLDYYACFLGNGRLLAIVEVSAWKRSWRREIVCLDNLRRILQWIPPPWTRSDCITTVLGIEVSSHSVTHRRDARDTPLRDYLLRHAT